jgi:hypothetical protein
VNRYLVIVAALFVVAALTGGGTGIAKPVKTTGGNVEVEFGGGFSPRALPKEKSAPIAPFLWGKFRKIDGTHPPALKEVRVKGDKSIELDVKDMPVCRSSGSGPRPGPTIASIRKECRRAIVATGEARGEIKFPDQNPIGFRSELLTVNGGVGGGVTTLYVFTSIDIPTPALIVTTVKVKKVATGRFGSEAIATVPKIAGGAGSITYFRLKLKRGVLRATCPDKRLSARIVAVFADDTKTSTGLHKPCVPQG